MSQGSKLCSHNVGVLTGRGLKQQSNSVQRKEGRDMLKVNFHGSLTEMLTKIDSIQLESGAGHSIPSNPFNQPINTKCSCGDVANLKTRAVDNTPISSESDDEDEICAGKIIDMLMAYSRRPLKKDRSAVFINLVSSFKPRNDGLHSVHLQQLKLLLSRSNPVKSCVLILLTRLAVLPANAKALIENGFLENLLTIVEEQDIALLKDALLCIIMLVGHKELCDRWILLMIQRGLPSLLNILRSNPGKNLVRSAASVLCTLASHHEIAVLLVDHGMQVIMESLRRVPELCEPVIRMFTHIVAHNDQLMAAVIDNNVLREVDTALRVGPCSEQIAAMGFCSQLSQDSYGTSCLLEEDTLRFLWQVIQSTNCVKVRGLGVKVIHSLLKCQDTNILKEFIIQIGRIHCEGDDLDEMANMSSIGTKRRESQSRAERGVICLSKLLINLLYREGKMSVNSAGKLQSIGYRGSHDPYCTMSDLIACLFLLCTLPISRSRRRTTSSKKVLFPCFSNKHRKPNLNTTSHLIENGALNIIHILNAYGNLLRDGSRHRQDTTSDRSIDTLHLQAIMKIWQNEVPDQILPLRSLADVLTSSELTFVLEIVSLLKLFAQICCTEWNSDLQRRLHEAIEVDQCERASHCDPESEVHPSHMMGDFEVTSAENPMMTAITMKEVQDCGDGLLEIRAIESKPDPDNAGIVSRRVAWEDNYRDVCGTIDVDSEKSFRKPLLETLMMAERDVLKLEDSVYEVHRRIRLKLCQEGLVDVLSLLVRCGVSIIEEEVLGVMKCLLQPVRPEECLPKSHDHTLPIKQKSLEEITKSLEMRDRLLSNVINSMSKKTADVMKEALKTDSSKKVSTKKIVRRRKKTEIKETYDFTSSIMKSPQRLTWHCTMYWLEKTGHVIIETLQDRDDGTVERLLLMLYDMLAYGDIIVYMKLASVGLIPALLELINKGHRTDFVNLLAILVLQKLTQDMRLKEMCKTEACFYELKTLVTTYSGIQKQELQMFFKGVEIPTDSLGLDIKVALGT